MEHQISYVMSRLYFMLMSIEIVRNILIIWKFSQLTQESVNFEDDFNKYLRKRKR